MTSDGSSGGETGADGTGGGRERPPEDGEDAQDASRNQGPTGSDKRTDGGRESGSRSGGQQQGQDGTGSPPETGNGGKPSLGRRISLVVLAALLAISLAGFSGVLAAQSTVLSGDYVADTMKDEGVYSDMETSFEDGIVDEAGASMSNSAVFDSDSDILENAIRESITRSYVESEMRGNVQEMYDYLHGRTDEPDLVMDATPITERISGAVAAEIEDIPLDEFVQHPAVGGSFESLGLTSEELGQTIADRETFRAKQEEVTQQLEESGQTADDLNQSLAEGTNLGDVTPEVEQSVSDLQGTVVVALTSDMSHDEYVSRMEEKRGAFAQAAGEYARQQFESGMGSSIDLTEGEGSEGGPPMQDARGVISQASTVLVVLPLLALAFLGAIVWVTRSVSRSSRILGVSLATVGFFGFVASFLVGDMVLSGLRESAAGEDDFMASTFITVVDGLFSRLAVQSAAMVVLGLVFVGVYYAIVKYEPEQIPPDWH